MILHLVTDRRRLAPRETRAGQVRSCLLSQARAAIAAGIDVVQVREPDLDAAVLRSLVADLVEMASRTATQIVVNDRLDVAIAAGASGVHLKETSAPVARVRALAPKGFLIGCSVHDEAAAREAAPHADYLIAGSVFPTISKPARTTWLGVAGLAAIVRAVSVPVIGIGASPACDGQVLVAEDLLGIFNEFRPKFVKRYAEIGSAIDEAVQRYAAEVRARTFPGPEHVVVPKEGH